MKKKDLGKFLTQDEVRHYGVGLKRLFESGRLQPKPLGKRVHLYAILPTDSTMTDAPVTVDMANAAVHKVIAVGPDVKDPRLVPGVHVVHISTAGSGVDDDKSNRFSTVDEEDILMLWDPSEIEDVSIPSSG